MVVYAIGLFMVIGERRVKKKNSKGKRRGWWI